MKAHKRNIQISTLAASIALGICSANATEAWDGEQHVGVVNGDVTFGGATVSAQWTVSPAPDYGPTYPDPQQLFEEEGINSPFLQWCPGVAVPGSPDYIPGLNTWEAVWLHKSGDADGYSCEEEYLKIYGEEEVDETNVLVMDPATLETQEINEFDPTGSGMDGNAATIGDSLALTSARALKTLTNKYDDNSAQKVSAYVTDWSQYDARLDGVNDGGDGVTVNETGRGFDLQKMIDNPTQFDTLIFSFMGICGDPHTSVASLAEHCTGNKNGGEIAEDGEVSLVDYWGDIASARNTGTAGVMDMGNDNWKSYIGNDNVGGAIGGMFAVQDAAREQGHDLELALSIGGWSMSGYFSEVAKTKELRDNFVSSLVEFAASWNDGEQPRFHRIDIDWEYPGFGPEGSDCTNCDQDGENYVTLLTELRAALDANQYTRDMKITLATVGVPEKMEQMEPVFAADIADDYFVMTYDYFGTGWADNLDHHANLYEGENSADRAIQYMKGLGVPAEKMHIGYAGYGRAGSHVTNFEAKQYDKTKEAFGGFENGAPELADIMFNWLDLGDSDKPEGKNGFELMTDINAKAQVLLNESTGHFISVETPTSVRAKAQYAKQQGLGGIFSWAGDQENGILSNAAHEGVGDTVNGEATWDMTNSYGCGTVFANWGGAELNADFVKLDENESAAVCKGTFENDFSGYTNIGNVHGSSFGPAKVGDYLKLEIKEGNETIAVSNHLVTSESQIAGGHRYAVYASGAMNNVLNSLDRFARFKVGERNAEGAVNTISSTHRNILYCGYDCEDVTITESVVSSTYHDAGQLKGYDVTPYSEITLTVKQGDDVYATTTYTPNEHMSVGFRWPDELCKVANDDNDTDGILECGELVGLDTFSIVNSSVYRNHIWSKDPSVSIEIDVQEPTN